MRGRSVHARAILRQVAAQRNGAASIAPPPAAARASQNARSFVPNCKSRSASTAARKLANSTVAATSPSPNDSSTSSGPSAPSTSSTGAGGPASAASAQIGKQATHPASSTSVRGKTLSYKPRVKGVSPANPPPSSLSNVAWESFFASDRPLLQHELLPHKSKRDGKSMQLDVSSLKNGALMEIYSADDAFGKFSNGAPSQWRRRINNIGTERFAKLIDGLAGTEESAALTQTEKTLAARSSLQFRPKSTRVALESAKLDEEERLKEEEEEAVHYALERGEDPEAARKLGAEADLIVLGEPDGPDPQWSRGVALHLAENCRAYEAPAAPKAQDGLKDEIKQRASLMSDRVVESVYFTDDDPNLMLSHALVQSSLPLALKWDALVAKMNAAALNDPSKSTEGLIDLTRLNAQLDTEEVMLDSTRRKRKKKMRKHKYKKLRKLQRPERQKLKK